MPAASSNVPRLVTVPEHCNLPTSVKSIVPLVASKVPFASNVPVLAVSVPFMSEVPVAVVDVDAIA